MLALETRAHHSHLHTRAPFTPSQQLNQASTDKRPTYSAPQDGMTDQQTAQSIVKSLDLMQQQQQGYDPTKATDCTSVQVQRSAAPLWEKVSTTSSLLLLTCA